jgi:formate dehydrogenase major subunit
MRVTRRGFLQATGVATAATLFGQIGVDVSRTQAHAETLKTRFASESTTICPYCAVGCGLIISTVNRNVINVEGDPDHPINEGSLCCKGQSLYQVANSNRRLTSVMYRAPGATQWEEKSWDWAIQKIVQRVKDTRDKYFIEKDGKGRTVNRLEAVAGLGGAALDNEECYLWRKFATALGMVYIEHQARI